MLKIVCVMCGKNKAEPFEQEVYLVDGRFHIAHMIHCYYCGEEWREERSDQTINSIQRKYKELMNGNTNGTNSASDSMCNV